jgi:hypothetical protein
MLRKIGIPLAAAGAVLFVVAFLHIITGNVPSECSGSECLRGEARWLLVLPASIFAFVGGVIMTSFGGRGYGRTAGPRSFADVDSGDWGPSQRQEQPTAGGKGGRWSRSWRNVYLYTGLGETGLALLFVIGGIAQPEARGGLFLTAGILGVVGVVFLVVGARAAAKDRLHTTGLEGEATIAGIQQTGMWMNNNPYVKLDLIIRVPGHPPYEVKHGEIVPQVLLGRLTSGTPLSVKVDPNKPSHFVVEWERA